MKLACLYYYALREHSSLGCKTPYQYLKQEEPVIDENIKHIIPIMLG